ncbi:hypothetical protein [Rubritalea tangerina]|uniref:hypothetical protein n=1 Tax=Rubritalea tangerina TaxID=430798 RepID=UPI00361FAB04
MYSGLWSFIIVNLMNIILSSKSWVRLPELSAFHAMSQISFRFPEFCVILDVET